MPTETMTYEINPMISDDGERECVRKFLHAQLKSAQETKEASKDIHAAVVAQSRIDTLLDVYRPLLVVKE